MNICLICGLLSLIGGLIFYLYKHDKMLLTVVNLATDLITTQKRNPKLFIDNCFENVKEVYPCTLLIARISNADFNGEIYDFSLYSEKNIISLISMTTKTDGNDDNKEEFPCAIIPNSEVYLMNDGTYIWDFRDTQYFQKEE